MDDTTSYFDCNASFGSPASGTFQPCISAETLLEEMDWVGVENALVHHALMRDQSPVVGNRALCDAIADHPRLHGTWAILPPQTHELPTGISFFEAMAKEGIHALWAFPQEHRYVLSQRTFGTFLDEVAQRHIPLFVPRDAGGTDPHDTWHLVYQLLKDYPSLTLVIAAHGPWGEDRFFRPLLEQHPNFCLDISRYELDGGLHDLVDKYGPDRLLYGSNFPDHAMGGPRMMVANGQLNDIARRAIAGDNLRRLLEEVEL
ncbi:MAG: amidohydrolase family protein [Anaerolineales bacterium]